MTPRASDSQTDHQSASRIVSVEARTITIPLENPTSFSTRQVFARDYVVVRVRTADGLVPTTPGLGFRLREDALDQYAAGPWA